MRFTKRKFFIGIFLIGGALFVISLLPFFREIESFWIITVVSVALMILSIVALLYRPRKKVTLNSKYIKKDEMLTEPERRFLITLRNVDPDKYEVLPQTALVNVIDKRTNTQYRGELFRVCDYCFADKKTFEPLLLVELNDSSHLRSDRRDRDEKVAAICKDAGIPLVTFWMDEDLSYATVKKTIKKAILK